LIQRVLRYWHKSQVQASYGEQFPRGIPNLHNLFFVLEDAIDWMSQEIPRFPQPFLAYFHLLPPHEPYMARRDFVDVFRDGWSPTVKPEAVFSDGVGPGELNRQRRHYDEYLAYADSEIGRLLEGLERSGVLENTILVFTSDHGEMFERGIRGHVTPMLYDPILHVPLLIRLPQQRERRDVYTPVSTVDILPTLLHLQGKDIPSWCEGVVLPGVREGTADSERGVFAVEAKSNPTQAPLTKASFALQRGPHKLTRYAGYRGSEAAYELYDLEADPEEQIDLLAVDRPLAKRLMAELDDKLREVDRPLG
jgi:arylsulfatase A-like enzyme